MESDLSKKAAINDIFSCEFKDPFSLAEKACLLENLGDGKYKFIQSSKVTSLSVFLSVWKELLDDYRSLTHRCLFLPDASEISRKVVSPITNELVSCQSARRALAPLRGNELV